MARNVVDTRRGEITTADARRLLARRVGVGAEGDVAVLLVPEGEERVRIELHAFAEDEDSVVLSRPELVLEWDDGDQAHIYQISARRRGAQWYMLSQLRDDLREGRLT